MTRVMYDAVTASNMPTNGTFYAYYINGKYANEAAVKAHAPGKKYIAITVFASTPAQKGMVLDVETGDATPAQAKAWLAAYPGSNQDLTLYCNTSQWPAVKAAVASLSTQPNYWVANYDGVATIPAGAIAKQYKTGSYDTSVVAAVWPGVDTASAPTTPTPPVKVPPVTTQPGYSGAPKLPNWSSISNQLKTMHDWEKQQFVLSLIPQGIYEGHNSTDGYDNNNVFGIYYGENLVSWCVILDWYVMAIAGLTGIVPKTDNVNSFTTWAKARGQWSEYPSVGAWVNFDNGGHTETVIGFDANYVYTKGGNTIPTGAADNGQGDGVWQHDNPGSLRSATRVVGYFAPKYADGVCPPTADPKDYRGGKAVTSYKYKAPAVTTQPVPPTTTSTTGVDMGVIVTYPKGAGWKGDFLLANGKLTHIPTAEVEAFLKSVGTPTQVWTAAKFNAVFAQIGA